jgi:cytochrome c oxidase cbb3-type subunit I/II
MPPGPGRPLPRETPSVMSRKTTITYDDRIVRYFMIASLVFGLVAMVVGVLIATQLSTWKMNGHFLEIITFGAFKSDGVQFLTFGRLRPLHTNAAIFAFVGNMLFAGIYYSLQRLCKVRLASDLLSTIHFWGWQLIIVAAAITLPLGLTQGKEYAELIWPIDIAVALVWVAFGLNMLLTIRKRNEPSLYVAIWFYIATFVTIAMLYIVNNLQMPTSWLHSYPVFGGVQDALVQWWYGHNAVAFFLTTPILGIMYYFVPKAANRPVYSYRLSIIHFWSLIFIYIWAGPHHLLNTALPKWLQLLGMFFSVMLWAPSWGGMLNGLLTLRGGWEKLRLDPVIKFFAAGVTFYGMATFEGPLLAIRSVNELSHYTDWTIGHVHSGALGWNGFMAAGMFYWLAPRLWRTKLWSTNLANLHFWVGTIGILLYVAAMWAGGVMQALMLGATNEAGTSLKYEFVQTLESIQWPFIFRSLGGGLYLVGFVLCAFNIWKTARSGSAADETVEITVEHTDDMEAMTARETWRNDPVTYSVWAIVFLILWILLPPHADLAAFVAMCVLSVLAILKFRKSSMEWSAWHERLLENYLPFTILVFGAVAVGGAVQIIPAVVFSSTENIEDRIQKLYSPLELAGRDVYVSEGCYNCHSQMIRTLKTDVMRYGDYSRLGESIYDHPFQWGSKRTGPDLAREGGRRGDDWHFNHFVNPRALDDGSNMPNYHFLLDRKTDIGALPGKIAGQQRVGVPYPAMTKDDIRDQAQKQAIDIATRLIREAKVSVPGMESAPPNEQIDALAESQMIALIAYVQKLGAFDPVEPKEHERKLLSTPDHNHDAE